MFSIACLGVGRRYCCWLLAAVLVPLPALAAPDPTRTIVVSAEGLADPNADTYKRDKGLMLEDLRRDARRQVIEKAVGTLVDSSTLVENYALIDDRILTQSKGLIKRVLKESPPWLGADGFMHILLRAEVYVISVRDALESMPALSRKGYIKQYGNPKISVAVTVRDAERGSDEYRSDIAENILKEHFKDFGYRVWSEETSQTLKLERMEAASVQSFGEATLSISHRKNADFTIVGKVKFDRQVDRLRASGREITRYVLTSWTVKCINNHTGEEVYYNNQVPRHRSWWKEDDALEEIGRLIGREFSNEFFEEQLMAGSRIYELQVLGLPSYDSGILLKKELVGLRPVLDVDYRTFSENGLSLFEVDFAGATSNFAKLVNSAVVKPLNTKFGERAFKLQAVEQGIVRVTFSSDKSPDEIDDAFNGKPPASLAGAPPERLRHIIRDDETMAKVAKIYPDAVQRLKEQGSGKQSGPKSAGFGAVQDF